MPGYWQLDPSCGISRHVKQLFSSSTALHHLTHTPECDEPLHKTGEGKEFQRSCGCCSPGSVQGLDGPCKTPKFGLKSCSKSPQTPQFWAEILTQTSPKFIQILQLWKPAPCSHRSCSSGKTSAMFTQILQLHKPAPGSHRFHQLQKLLPPHQACLGANTTPGSCSLVKSHPLN